MSKSTPLKLKTLLIGLRLSKIVFAIITILLSTTIEAQVATYYNFSQSSGTYTPGVSTTSTTPADIFITAWDDLNYTGYTLPFTFTYNGVAYTNIGVDDDAWITFSNGVPVMTGGLSGGSWVSISDHTGVFLNGTANNNGFAGFNCDLNDQAFPTFTGSRTSGSPTITGVSSTANLQIGTRLVGTGITDGTVVTSVVGTTVTMSSNATATSSTVITPRASIYAFTRGVAPNRQFIIQWTQARRYSGTLAENINFQLILNEGNANPTLQTLQVVYGNCTTSETATLDAQVGLRGAATIDFNARKSTTGWAITTAATLNTDIVRFSNTILPASGLTFTWSPCTVAPGAAGSISGSNPVCAASTATYTLTAVPTATSYTWTYSGTGASFTATTAAPSNTISFSAGATSGNLTVTPVNLCGNGTASSLSLTIAAAPVAAISYPSSSYCLSTSGTIAVTQTGTTGGTYSTNPATGLTINGTGGITPSSSAAGIYTVIYSFTNGTCSNTTSTTVTINPSPTVTATATPPLVCNNGNSQLLATVANNSNYTVNSIGYSALTPSGSPTVLWSTTYTDDAQSAVALPFTFTFFGTAVTTLNVSTNGYVELTAASGTATVPQTLPDVTTPNNVIALAWADLIVDNTTNPGCYVRYFVNGTTPNRIAVIDYYNLRFIGGTGAQNVTGQMRLYESDNHIEVAVGTVNDNSTFVNKTLGIENSTGTLGVSPTGRNNVVWNTGSEAWAFYVPVVTSYSYLWTPATYLSSTTINNPVAGSVASTTVYNVKVTDNTTGCFTNTGVTVTTSAPLSGIYTVGAGGNYTTLTAAVNAYNTLCIGGPVIFSLIDPTYSASETFPININSNAYQSAVNTLTIRPAAGVNATISGAAANDALIRISGKYISINGSNNNTTTRNLSITNTSTTSPTVVLLGSLSSVTPVTNVSLKNCTITNGINSSSAIVVSASIAGTAGYFSNDTIQNNIVQKAYIGIYCIGVNSAGNGSGLTILSNNLTSSGVNALYIAGIYAQDIDGVTIEDNQVANLVGTDSYDDKGIWLATGVINSNVLRNTIANLNYTGGLGYGAYGICITTGVTNANILVANNMIANISGDGFNYTSASFALDNPTGIMLFTTQTGIKLYFNSINLGTAGFTNTLNSSNAISAGIRLYTGSTADIRNNIIVNNLGRTGASTTTGYGAIGILTSTNNAQVAGLNYNDYVISPSGSITKYFGQIAATGQTTLAGWQGATAGDANSINITPVFTSPTDLHLSPPASNLSMNNTGTPIAGITVDYDTTTRNGLTPDMGADEFLAPNTGSWVGKTSIDWLVNTNWETNKIPDRSTDVSITGGYTFMPTVVTTQAVRGLLLSAPVPANTPILTLNAGTLQVYGTITRTGGSIDGSNGTFETDSSIANTVPASLFVNNNLKNLVVNNGGGLTLGGALDIYRSVTFGAAGVSLTTGSNLTFKSTATETAWLGNMTGKTLTGTATIERYIPTGINHNKSWQLLAAPVKSAVSLKVSWMENNATLANAKPGYGTTISSEVTGATTRGYDFYTPISGSSGGPSLKTYVPATNTWAGFDDGVTATGSKALTPQKKGYFIFVRGDRSVTTSGAAAVPTVLRITGTPYTNGANIPPVTTVLGNSFETIGNPYPSAIDFTAVTRAAGVDNVFYLWDPLLPGTNNLGGYQTVSGITGYLPTPGSANYPAATPVTKIQSGQAFFVHGTAGGNVSFTEASKVSGSSLVLRPAPLNLHLLRLNLYKVSTAGFGAVDGNVIALDKDYSNAFDHKDALKISNTGENIGIFSNDKLLAVEARKPFIKNDTVFYNIGNLRLEAYQLRFGPENINANNLAAFLVDRFLNTTTPVSLSDSTTIDFNITSDAGSYAANRFYLIFKRQAANKSGEDEFSNLIKAAPVQKVQAISVYPNPVVNKILSVLFSNQPYGIYHLELSNQLGQVILYKTLQVNSNNVTVSIQLGKEIAAGSYQLSIIAGNGKKTIQQVMVK